MRIVYLNGLAKLKIAVLNSFAHYIPRRNGSGGYGGGKTGELDTILVTNEVRGSSQVQIEEGHERTPQAKGRERFVSQSSRAQSARR